MLSISASETPFKCSRIASRCAGIAPVFTEPLSPCALICLKPWRLWNAWSQPLENESSWSSWTPLSVANRFAFALIKSPLSITRFDWQCITQLASCSSIAGKTSGHVRLHLRSASFTSRYFLRSCRMPDIVPWTGALTRLNSRIAIAASWSCVRAAFSSFHRHIFFFCSNVRLPVAFGREGIVVISKM